MLCGEGRGPGSSAAQWCRWNKGCKSPSRFPALPRARSTRQHQGNKTRLQAAGSSEDRGGSTRSGVGMEAFASQGVIRTTGSCTSRYQVHLRALGCAEGRTALSGRRSDWRSSVGAVAAVPRRTHLSLIPAERSDNDPVCRQGNPKRGVPPGKTLCWTWASAANTCEKWIPKCAVTGWPL